MLQRTPPPHRRPRATHIWAPDPHGWYVEPHWCDSRLFDVETFDRTVWDPCCGWGRIPQAAIAAGYRAIGSDIVYRSAASKVSEGVFFTNDFLCDPPVASLREPLSSPSQACRFRSLAIRLSVSCRNSSSERLGGAHVRLPSSGDSNAWRQRYGCEKPR